MNKRIEDWLRLINAETEDDLIAIEETTQIPEVREVVDIIRELSADEKVRHEAFYREKQLRDQASALKAAEAIGMQKGMQSVIQHDTPNADTILAIQEVESLKKDSNKKVYDSFSEVLGELADDGDE